MVRKTGFGAIFDSEAELERLFETGDVSRLAAAKRPSGVRAKFSNMTADLIQGEAA